MAKWFDQLIEYLRHKVKARIDLRCYGLKRLAQIVLGYHVGTQALHHILCVRHRRDGADIDRFHLRDQFEDAGELRVRGLRLVIADGDARKVRHALHVVQSQ